MKLYLKKILTIICTFILISCVILGCKRKEGVAQSQLKDSILQPNLQGVKEALRNNKSIVNKRMAFIDRRKPLELAVREIESEKIQLEICKLLIKEGAVIDQKGIDKNTNLCWALMNNRFSLAELMIEEGADVNLKGDEDTLPLECAVNGIRLKYCDKNQAIINKLLSLGAKVDADFINKFLKTENWGMQYYFAPYVANMGLRNGEKQKISAAVKAAVFGNDVQLQRLIKGKRVKKNEKELVLALACAYCTVDTLKILKQYQYDFSWKDGNKVGLLHIAAMCNDVEVVEYLLNIGAKGNQKVDFYEADAVSYAVLSGKLENAKKLITKGGVNYRRNSEFGQNVTWEFISAFGNRKSCETLNRLGYHPSAAEIYSMFEACSEDQFQYLQTIERNTYIKKYGNKILSCLSLNSTEDFYLKMYKKGARPDEDQLENLIWNGRSDIVIKIMESSKSKQNIKKEVLLQSAINIGDFDMVKYLVEQGADINKYVEYEDEKFLWTSLQMAYARQSNDIVKYLKQQGGDEKKKDTKGKTCEEIAEEAEAIWNQ